MKQPDPPDENKIQNIKDQIDTAKGKNKTNKEIRIYIFLILIMILLKDVMIIKVLNSQKMKNPLKQKSMTQKTIKIMELMRNYILLMIMNLKILKMIILMRNNNL